MTEAYDSRQDTMEHIQAVYNLLQIMTGALLRRAKVHDESKLHSPEKEIFDEYTPKLKYTTYGSDEYKQYLKEMKVALDSHYAKNSHHPEYYDNGIAGMTLIDLVEMFCDWMAATERHADGNMLRSIEQNRARFGISDQLASIFRNTMGVFDKTESECTGS